MPMMYLFPAHAGVIPDAGAGREILGTFPRTRGGDPTEHHWKMNYIHFSRIRGGDPAYKILEETLNLFSPHTRG